MTKLIIQIPCYNEEATLGETVAELPGSVPGIDSIELLVVDDGSTDNTVKVAKEAGVQHIVSHTRNMGLAQTFLTGVSACLDRGADIIVNTDADNQYKAEFIPALVKPIVDGRADVVIGARPIGEIEEFSPLKKHLQKLGSWVVRLASKTDIPDAPSGFRAFSRQAALKLNVFNDYTYTLETIIQAGQKNIPTVWVPVSTNKSRRPSRLVKSIPSYVKRSILTIVRIFAVYSPFRFFLFFGVALLMAGLLIGLRFLWFLWHGEGGGHVQSLILASILIGTGFQTCMVAFIADLLSVNRKLLEDLQFHQRKRSGNNNPRE